MSEKRIKRRRLKMIAQQLKLRGKKSGRWSAGGMITSAPVVIGRDSPEVFVPLHAPMMKMANQDPARFEHPNCRCMVIPVRQEAQAVIE